MIIETIVEVLKACVSPVALFILALMILIVYIFKEDLEDRERLNNKIINIFQVNSVIPHSDFSYDLMFRIRRSLEPNIKENIEGGKVLPYSKLYIIPDMPNITEVEEMIDTYFMGVKSIIFVGDSACYKNIIRCLNDGLRKRKVQFTRDYTG